MVTCGRIDHSWVWGLFPPERFKATLLRIFCFLPSPSSFRRTLFFIFLRFIRDLDVRWLDTLRCRRRLDLPLHVTRLHLRRRQLVRSTLRLPRSQKFRLLRALRPYLLFRLLPQNMAHIRPITTLFTFPLPLPLQQALTRVTWCIQALADTAQYHRQDHLEAIVGRIRRHRLMRVVEVGERAEYPPE